MSGWTDFRDKYVKFATGGLIDPEASRKAEQDQKQLIAEQMKAYKDQTEILRNETNRARDEENVEKRRIQEKQIRSLRRNYRPTGGGMLGIGEPAAQDMSSKLGS